MLEKTLNHLAVAALALLPATGWSATTADAAQAEKAATAYRKSAEQGNANAALQLGNLLHKGQVATTKFGDAADWYKTACTLDELSACHNVGVAYENGRNGVKRDYAEAAAYYLLAAERAFLPSQFNLAALHANSHVTSLDNREGLKWLLVAQKSARQCADKPVCQFILADQPGHRARLEARLSASEQREARQLADAWQPVR